MMTKMKTDQTITKGRSNAREGTWMTTVTMRTKILTEEKDITGTAEEETEKMNQRIVMKTLTTTG